MESGDDARIPELRAACAAAVAGLAAARPGLMVIVGRADRTAEYESTAAGSLRDFGVPFSTGAGPPVLPLSLTVGAWLVRRFAAMAADGTGPRPSASPFAAPVARVRRGGCGCRPWRRTCPRRTASGWARNSPRSRRG